MKKNEKRSKSWECIFILLLYFYGQLYFLISFNCILKTKWLYIVKAIKQKPTLPMSSFYAYQTEIQVETITIKITTKLKWLQKNREREGEIFSNSNIFWYFFCAYFSQLLLDLFLAKNCHHHQHHHHHYMYELYLSGNTFIKKFLKLLFVYKFLWLAGLLERNIQIRVNALAGMEIVNRESEAVQCSMPTLKAVQYTCLA